MADPDPSLTFIIGAARSGTTWLARSLGADPRVVATYETHLFNAYLGPVLEVWRQHVAEIESAQQRWVSTGEPPRSAIGLPYVLDQDQFLETMEQIVDRTFSVVAEDAAPGTEAIVEKTPSHSAHVRDIELLTGGRARYIHLIRSGYEVVESTTSASAGWASNWAPSDAVTAAHKWAASVRAARRAASFGDRYIELRYEDLVASPATALRDALRFIGIDADLQDATKALAQSGTGLHLGGVASETFSNPFPEPRGFRREVTAPSERTIAIVNAIEGELLRDLGYLRSDSMNSVVRGGHVLSGRLQGTAAQLRRFGRRIGGDIRGRRPVS